MVHVEEDGDTMFSLEQTAKKTNLSRDEELSDSVKHDPQQNWPDDPVKIMKGKTRTSKNSDGTAEDQDQCCCWKF